ncbi:catechol-2,3-dioxygenase [Bradyrhizobium sp. LM6.10]
MGAAHANVLQSRNCVASTIFSEPRNAPGLYHTALLMPTRKDLARWLVHAASYRVPMSGFADHLVSESVYLDDPEGNGIEVYAAVDSWGTRVRLIRV